MRVDLDRQLCFPVEITATSLRPDIVVWSTKAKSVLLIELIIPAEGGDRGRLRMQEGQVLRAGC